MKSRSSQPRAFTAAADRRRMHCDFPDSETMDCIRMRLETVPFSPRSLLT
jgi:hypothetical protein